MESGMGRECSKWPLGPSIEGSSKTINAVAADNNSPKMVCTMKACFKMTSSMVGDGSRRASRASLRDIG